MKNYVIIAYDPTSGRVSKAFFRAQPFDDEAMGLLNINTSLNTLSIITDGSGIGYEGQAVDYIVQNGVLTYLPGDDAVARAKKTKFLSIDQRTDALIKNGFQYQGMSFSLSLEAQARMMGMDQLRADPAMVYPILWNSIDDTSVATLATANDIHTFALTAVGFYRAAIDSGTALKSQVRAAKTVADVTAVKDAR